MARAVNYDAKIEALKEKIEAKSAQLAKLKAQLSELEAARKKIKYGDMMKVIEEKALDPDAVMAAIEKLAAEKVAEPTAEVTTEEQNA